MTNLCGFKFRLPTISKATAPTASDIGENGAAFWQDTANSKVYLCYNYGGVVKYTEVTSSVSPGSLNTKEDSLTLEDGEEILLPVGVNGKGEVWTDDNTSSAFFTWITTGAVTAGPISIGDIAYELIAGKICIYEGKILNNTGASVDLKYTLKY